jgi:hypothetical protein
VLGEIVLHHAIPYLIGLAALIPPAACLSVLYLAHECDYEDMFDYVGDDERFRENAAKAAAPAIFGTIFFLGGPGILGISNSVLVLFSTYFGIHAIFISVWLFFQEVFKQGVFGLSVGFLGIALGVRFWIADAIVSAGGDALIFTSVVMKLWLLLALTISLVGFTYLLFNREDKGFDFGKKVGGAIGFVLSLVELLAGILPSLWNVLSRVPL